MFFAYISKFLSHPNLTHMLKMHWFLATSHDLSTFSNVSNKSHKYPFKISPPYNIIDTHDRVAGPMPSVAGWSLLSFGAEWLPTASLTAGHKAFLSLWLCRLLCSLLWQRRLKEGYVLVFICGLRRESSGQGGHGSRRARQRVTLNPKQERVLLVFSSLSVSYSVQNPACEMGPPPFWLNLLSSLKPLGKHLTNIPQSPWVWYWASKLTVRLAITVTISYLDFLWKNNMEVLC